MFPSFGRFSFSVETFGIGTDAGGRVTGGAGDAGLGGEGGGAFDAPTGLTGLEEPREVGVDVADRGAGAERLRRSVGRAAGPRLREKGCAGGENEATTRSTFVVSGGTTGGGPSAWGPVVRRSDEAQTEAPTVAKAGKRGPIRATICFISAPATRRLAFSTPRFSSAQSDGHLNGSMPGRRNSHPSRSDGQLERWRAIIVRELRGTQVDHLELDTRVRRVRPETDGDRVPDVLDGFVGSDPRRRNSTPFVAASAADGQSPRP